MPEPTRTAKLAGEILPGVYRFTMHDDRIESQSDSYAIIEKGKAILIDPLPIAKKDLKKLGPVEAICLTGSCHERSAWRYRRELKVPVYAPQGGVDFEETPDRWYKANDRLPGNLLAVHTPGPMEARSSAQTCSPMPKERVSPSLQVNTRMSRRARVPASAGCWSCSLRYSARTTAIPCSWAARRRSPRR